MDGPDTIGTGPWEQTPTSPLLYVTWRDMDTVIDKAYARQDPRLKKIETSVRSIKRTCKKREGICPALNIDKDIEIRKKKREAEQEEKKDRAAFWVDYGKSIILGVGILITATLGVVIGAIAYAKGMIP